MSSKMNTVVHVYNMNVRTYIIYVSNPMLGKWAVFFIYCVQPTFQSVSRNVRFSYCLYLRVRSLKKLINIRKKAKKNCSRKIIYSNKLRYIIVTKTAVCFALNLCLVQWHTTTTRKARWDITNNFSVKQQQMRLFVVPCSVSEFAQF